MFSSILRSEISGVSLDIKAKLDSLSKYSDISG
ncbi:hypothetical protein M947_07310 [Sulfurimonas hongkongensis]|uniref:Uncharacterized protein n=1 Tax=Sulfurimonas hongkongensis TaxID=1172190 RepID=T0KQL3_9BACT|nr:hypothetical protein M947_07310 [Sulfurimonas hongkongensis]